MFFILLFITSVVGFGQTPTRIKISAITPSENTGQNYTPWLNDDLTSLVQSAWGNNSKWVDVKLTLEKRTKVTKLSLYDYEGTFSDNPVSIYGLDGTAKTLIGTFEGLTYKQFVDIVVKNPFDIDAIIIHKYGNNIPQKIQIYGTEATTASTVVITPTPEVTPIAPVVTASRVNIIEIKAGENTGQDYTPWLNDDLNSLVSSAWGSNAKWVDIRLKLEHRTKITKLSLYDYEGTFTDNPVSIYALDGSTRIFLGLFEGLTYKQFVDLAVATPVDADAIIIHKYSNNIPQKVRVYGLPTITTATSPLGDVVPLGTNTPPTITVVPPTPITPTIIGTKIPLDGKRWYQLNNTHYGLEGLTDGILGVSVEAGWGKVMSNWDAYYPLASDEQMTLQSIRFRDGQGIFVNQPMTLSIITDTWEKITVAKFTGELYNEWVGPDPTTPNTFVLKNPPTANIRYLLINTYGNYPTEIELYGTYTASTKTLAAVPKKTIKMKQGLGVNGFEWDFYDIHNSSLIDENKFKAMKSFGGFRHYIDWDKLEAKEGSYTFNPTFNGGWNYDAIYQRCKLEDIEVLACIQTAPDWLVNTYPVADRDNNISPVKYGKSVLDPTSYIEQARVAFQYAARFGSNTNVDQSLLSVYNKPRWTNDNVNSIKVGLGVVKYMECGNERDKWWRGRNAYQTAREHAANLSAFYDGHKNTMGPGVGVKNADPTMKVVMAGLSFAKPDYVRGMIDWCKEFRGYNPDGSVNLCWDVVNYHLYADNGNSTQGGNSTRGAAPEVSDAGKIAKDFIQMSHEYLNDMPVWITELGYDLNQGSPLKAIPIGEKSEYITQADWALRSSLMYNRLGIERSFFYEVYDDNFANPIQFGSSGLINQDLSRRPAADYIYQTNKLMGNYVYMETISQDPIVDRYELNGKSAYILAVPDEKGRTVNYTLNLNNIAKANIYSPRIGTDSMNVTSATSVGGQFSLTVTETPLFLFPTETMSTTKAVASKTRAGFVAGNDFNVAIAEKSLAKEQPLQNTLKAYPNPTIDYLLLTLDNKSLEQIEVQILDASMGKTLFHDIFEKTEDNFSTKLDVVPLPAGSYVVEIIQGNKRVTKKIVKAN
ncbi:T9SS type A sorting domain-containing protein [Emticicia sp. SJ17W-69]|uniref:T9SS type A sorting domain-containing protein n=1 Tax=Emticicia sp. SJ17W-69 TaxID=3421657 RepID=UPI003EBDEF56